MTLLAALFVLLWASIYGASYSQSGSVAVDLFTQKVPFGGKGPNTPSDSFQPLELVILYANVTYSGAPVVGLPVSFQIEGPANTFNNLTIFGTGSTNQSGLATFSFRIPLPAAHQKEITFGKWFGVATVNIAEQVAQDTLTFRVGWILQITSITTLNYNLIPQTTFFRQDIINFNLTVENIALVDRLGTVTIEVEDASLTPIISIAKTNLTFQPGKNQANGSSLIPNTAAIGNATVWAAIYTAPPNQNGPALSSQFVIGEETRIHDIGVTNVVVSPSIVDAGDMVNIYVTVKNNGTANENDCILRVYYNVSSTWIPIETLPISLSLGTQARLPLSWNTSSVRAGLYQIKAYVYFLPNNQTDVSPDDNTLVNGSVQVVVHDISIVSVTVSSSSVNIGSLVNIYVTVKNNGTSSESFSLSAYYNSSLIKTLQVSALALGESITKTFTWNTSSVSAGIYQIKAYASLPSNEVDISPGDNTLADGFVQVMTAAPPFTPRTLFIILLVILLLFLLALLALLVLRRRKADESEMLDQISYFI